MPHPYARVVFPIFKYGLYLLLAVNIYLFFRHATWHEGLDCLGWFLLLMLFEWETAHAQPQKPGGPGTLAVLALSLPAYGMILYAWLRYAQDEQWLDFLNASLWLLVVAGIEADIHGRATGRATMFHNAAKLLLYTALVIVAAIWGVTGDLLNFYDAALWIGCFFFIELNLFDRLWK